MAKTFDQLVKLLDLETIEVNTFRGTSILGTTAERVFGGQVAAQALVAAGRTVDPQRYVHSFHSYFLRPGDTQIPILYEVDRIRDGRSFTTRRVVAIQHGEAIYNMQCSFHIREEGLEHQIEMPGVPPANDFAKDDPNPPGPGQDYNEAHGIDIRDVRLPGEGDAIRPRMQAWVRVAAELGNDPLLHSAVLAFTSDITPVQTILRQHFNTPRRDQVQAASLDHCIWFHRPFRADGWLLHDMSSPAASGARGLTHGSIYNAEGHLVASIAQEGLIRLIRDQ